MPAKSLRLKAFCVCVFRAFYCFSFVVKTFRHDALPNIFMSAFGMKCEDSSGKMSENLTSASSTSSYCWRSIEFPFSHFKRSEAINGWHPESSRIASRWQTIWSGLRKHRFKAERGHHLVQRKTPAAANEGEELFIKSFRVAIQGSKTFMIYRGSGGSVFERSAKKIFDNRMTIYFSISFISNKNSWQKCLCENFLFYFLKGLRSCFSYSEIYIVKPWFNRL